MRHLIFLGFKCAGKSTLGQAYAQQQGLKWIDTDAQLIHLYQTSNMKTLYQDLGPDMFAQAEFQIISRLDLSQPTVLSVGGSTPLLAQNQTQLKSLGLMVYLHTQKDILYQRILTQPILPHFIREGHEALDFENTYNKRHPQYQSASNIMIPLKDEGIQIQLNFISKAVQTYGQ